ncbi:MAG TPA: nitroreductase family deazaflavin-dependent oxidoreductase [Actinomycetota bacterium]|nr:nitroreductase family deazaflavin-dependent oxidoreductase [Actinomycetota bacterium]
MPETERFPRWMVEFVSHKWGRNFARGVYTPLDKAIYKLTGGRRGLSPPQTVLYLTTTGRKSGKPRRVPVLFLRDGDRYWVMASNYGTQRHPAWSANLLANPEATIQRGTRTVEVRARLASREEKDQLWPRLLELYPAWKQYSEWTDRDFRLFCLEPR